MPVPVESEARRGRRIARQYFRDWVLALQRRPAMNTPLRSAGATVSPETYRARATQYLQLAQKWNRYADEAEAAGR